MPKTPYVDGNFKIKSIKAKGDAVWNETNNGLRRSDTLFKELSELT